MATLQERGSCPKKKNSHDDGKWWQGKEGKELPAHGAFCIRKENVKWNLIWSLPYVNCIQTKYTETETLFDYYQTHTLRKHL